MTRTHARELNLGREAFALVSERGPDWERIEQETKARERERLEAERIEREQQTKLWE